MITSFPQHDIFLVYPVLALLDDDALVWLPLAPHITKKYDGPTSSRILRTEIRAENPSYDAYSARLSSLRPKQHVQTPGFERSGSVSSSAPSTPSDARPRQSSRDYFDFPSPGTVLADDINNLANFSGQSHLELATYINNSDFTNTSRSALEHVRLRFRRITETAYGELSYAVYELDIKEWYKAQAVAAQSGRSSWWDTMNQQIWRSTRSVFTEVTRRFDHQGVCEALPIWSFKHWPSSPVDFRPFIPQPTALQAEYGIVCRYRDPKNEKLKAYIQHKSRDCLDDCRASDRIVLPLLRETAFPGDVDGNWEQAFCYAHEILGLFGQCKSKRNKPDDTIAALRPYLERWRRQTEQVFRQQRAMDESTGRLPSGFHTRPSTSNSSRSATTQAHFIAPDGPRIAAPVPVVESKTADKGTSCIPGQEVDQNTPLARGPTRSTDPEKKTGPSELALQTADTGSGDDDAPGPAADSPRSKSEPESTLTSGRSSPQQTPTKASPSVSNASPNKTPTSKSQSGGSTPEKTSTAAETLSSPPSPPRPRTDSSPRRSPTAELNLPERLAIVPEVPEESLGAEKPWPLAA